MSQALPESEVRDRLAGLDGWRLEDGQLRRDLRFASFPEAFGFMTSVAIWAQQQDHHPDWSNVYDRVSIALSSHDAGGITERDFRLAGKIDALARLSALKE